MRHSAYTRAIFVLAILGALILVNFGVAGFSLHGVLIMLIILALLLPMGWRHVQGRLDIFEPVVLANVALGVMFIGRPLTDIALETKIHLFYGITSTFDDALLVVLAGVLAFQIGYYVSFARTWAKMLRRPPAFSRKQAQIAAWLFLMFGGILFAFFLASGGGIALLFVLLKGRSSEDNAIFLNTTAYFNDGILMWAASALVFFALAVVYKRRMNYVWFLATVLPLIIYLGALGTRSDLLPLALSLPVFWYLWKGHRPSARLLLVTATVGIVLIGWLGQIRTAGTSARAEMGTKLVEAFTSPAEQMGNILSGGDDEMFDSIANEMLVVPRQTGYRPGGTLMDLFIRAVPRPLWPDKPLETNDILVNTLWPAHYAASRASAAFSIIGPFYLDSGYIGVLIGMFFIGVVLATTWQWYLLHRRNLNVILIYSMGLPFVVILMRGTLPDTIARMLFMVVPLAVVMWISRMRTHTSVARVRFLRGG